MSEQPILMYDSRQDAVNQIAVDFEGLSTEAREALIRLYAGSTDLVPLMQPGEPRDAQAITAQRLRRIARYNTHEGQGSGCILAVASAAINHA